jgi:hypothetical protein
MPLEIRELHIKVNVNQPKQSEGQDNLQMAGSEAKKKEEERDAILNQCIDEVMDIINRKNDR